MAKIHELPPFPQGTEQQQINQLRDYLIKLVMELNEEAKNGEAKK